MTGPRPKLPALAPRDATATPMPPRTDASDMLEDERAELRDFYRRHPDETGPGADKARAIMEFKDIFDRHHGGGVAGPVSPHDAREEIGERAADQGASDLDDAIARRAKARKY